MPVGAKLSAEGRSQNRHSASRDKPTGSISYLGVCAPSAYSSVARWAPADDGTSAMKFSLTARALKEAGNGTRWILPAETRLMAIDEIHEVTADITAERHFIAELLKSFQNPEDDGPAVPHAKPPQRLHLIRQRERQRQMDIAAAEQRRQQKPLKK